MISANLDSKENSANLIALSVANTVTVPKMLAFVLMVAQNYILERCVMFGT